mmetsp:Transcript_19784/g.30874  ORF Transcript_19784/g.30874 Transcript_19784/m.30874 type:complete len:400 (-) Transcript_19784:364-1563(-)|eukprot:CAMPEP_0201742582 /NCGR_PEP_ID=MMETSP0593-20130828/47395_1 /ASSEMBLY_ACC=CAM_ASM_000672 /TAXON_ID=267983 /ORGANISM="Skeletonema japonicum, Strain CCMP2506" /LENGTH=399 /DNA_ID=CAMNT_0048236939 /DNA_START=83 /DNA_END=1282 /DNA_ORIENTATION=-
MVKTETRRAHVDKRHSSMEDSAHSNASSRLGSEELSKVANISTRRLLENMDETQIERAMKGLKVARLKRRESLRRMSSVCTMPGESLDMSAGRNKESTGRRSSMTDINGSNDPKSVASNVNDDPSGSDAQFDDIGPPPFHGREKENITDAGTLSVSSSDSDEEGCTQDHPSSPELFNHMDRGLTKLHEENEEDNEGDASCDGVESKELDPTPLPRVKRRTGLGSIETGIRHSKTKWKPLSTPSVDNSDDAEAQEKEREENEVGKLKSSAVGLGGMWNNLRKSLTGDSTPVEAKPDAAKYFRRGKRRAERCQFLEAVALFNLALVQQREELGENHIDCGRTLNEIGLCWFMLGERYPAMTAFEESLYILQKILGDGAEEVAEVTNNIWMVLHEQREENGE